MDRRIRIRWPYIFQARSLSWGAPPAAHISASKSEGRPISSCPSARAPAFPLARASAAGVCRSCGISCPSSCSERRVLFYHKICWDVNPRDPDLRVRSICPAFWSTVSKDGCRSGCLSSSHRFRWNSSLSSNANRTRPIGPLPPRLLQTKSP